MPDDRATPPPQTSACTEIMDKRTEKKIPAIAGTDRAFPGRALGDGREELGFPPDRLAGGRRERNAIK
jgi:hypothetical protein